jgi:type VI secretion system protein ImpG
MRDELLGYYERELAFLRQMGADFAEKYPKVASRLLLEPDRCEDPHVERMIEAAAFLASRVHLKIDDEFPEVTESLLNVLYPGFLAPVPSLSIVQFIVDPERANLQTGQTVPRGSMIYSNPVEGSPCRFQTSYPVTIWPIELVSVRFELPAPGSIVPPSTRSVLRLELRTFGGLPFSGLREKTLDEPERPLDRLRFYLQGDAKLVHSLYEHLFTSVSQIAVRPAGGDERSGFSLPGSALLPVGFGADEGLLPASNRSFLGYRLVQEYFAFPEKYLFFDLTGLERASGAELSSQVDVLLYLDREFPLERGVAAQTFRLNCAPVANLFEQMAEPVRLTQLQSEYRVIPDVGRQSSMEVYSVDEVTGVRAEQERSAAYQPFYSIRHSREGAAGETFWHATRRSSPRKDDEGTEVYLTFVDLSFRHSLPETDTLTVRTTCSNRDLPGRLPFGNPEGDFHLEGAGVFSAIRCLRKPTPSLRLPLRRGAHWRLISHLSLNYLSLVERTGASGPDALQEILKLYDFSDSSATRQQINGITGVEARRVLRPIGTSHAGFVRGVEVKVDFDEQQFIGSGVFLFASVLERFLGLYASVNSFTQMVATSRQREGILKRWPARAGEQIVL